jgi:hypothetical protein
MFDEMGRARRSARELLRRHALMGKPMDIKAFEQEFKELTDQLTIEPYGAFLDELGKEARRLKLLNTLRCGRGQGPN